MMIHVSGYGTALSASSFEWQVLNLYDSLVRWGVPVFVMISGALFLNPHKVIPFRKIYTKYIFRIVTAFVFWSFIYAIINYAQNRRLSGFIAAFIAGHYHMWFLFMIAGLYMIIPFMRIIAGSEKLTTYFLVLALVFTFVMPSCVRIVSAFLPRYEEFVSRITNNFFMHFTGGYAAYFLLGYVLDKIEISPRLERYIYAAGILGAVFTVVMNAGASLFNNNPHEYFYNNMTVNVLCMAVGVFVFCRKHFNFESMIIRKLSGYSFGMYLVHDSVLIMLRHFGLNNLTFNPVFSVPLIGVLVFVISFGISAVLHHVPLLKKYAA